MNSYGEYPVVPDPEMTPGDVCTRQDRHFDGYRYREKIAHCKRSVKRGLKSKIYNDYQIPSRCRNRYTIDHFYPLSIGGNNSVKNLWPEHVFVKALREDLEQDVFDQVAQGRLKQKEAFEIIYEAKMNPPVEELKALIVQAGSSSCDKAALEYYYNF